jgi:hypothetical protein
VEENNGNKLKEYVLKFSIKEKNNLGAIRNLNGILAAQEEEVIWVRGFLYTETLPLKVRQLPVLNSYLMNSDNLLFVPGKITPIGRLGEMQWIPLAEYIDAEFPVAALPGQSSRKLLLKLVPSTAQEKSFALLTDLKSWKTYVEEAPEIRFRDLRFAVSENGDVLVLGTPLSPIPGKEYWCREHVLLPCGFDFNYSFIVESIVRKLNLSDEHYLLFYPDGSWNKIPVEAFREVSRSAVRKTQ